jgi:CheY-like chemotaxis protein
LQFVISVTSGFHPVLYISSESSEKIKGMMFFKKQAAVPAAKDLTGEHLRAADRLIREKKYHEAILEIECAQQLDPDNMYIRSLFERTRFLIEKEQERKSRVFGEYEMTSEHRMEAIAELFATIEIFIAEKKYPKALNELAKVFQIDPKNYYAQAFSDRIITLMRADTAARKNNASQILPTPGMLSDVPPSVSSTSPAKDERSGKSEVFSPPPAIPSKERSSGPDILLSTKTSIPSTDNGQRQPEPLPPSPSVPADKQQRASEVLQFSKTASAGSEDGINQSTPIPAVATQNTEHHEKVRRFALYRELLKECWIDGVITPEESDMLHRARVQYGIPFDTHCKIEVDIKIEAYVDALRIVWLDGVVDQNEQEVLDIMRKKFGITKEEQAAAEAKFSASRTSKQIKAVILIVDSDYHNSIYVARVLISRGYDVKIERRPDDALRFMDMRAPDLILSEAVFPTSAMDGFDFFQRTRLNERVRQIPFLMMTNSDNGRVTRAGLRMGVDYVIPKPIHIGYLISIIEGRLKSGQNQSDAEKRIILFGKRIAHLS